MTEVEHIKRHQELHKYLDELLADWISQENILPSKVTVMELIQWSFEQSVKPTLPVNQEYDKE